MRLIKLLSISLCLLLAAFLQICPAQAQIKIGTNGSIIAPSSLLELESVNQGLLLPRLPDTVAINLLNPPNGMLIYMTKVPAVGLYVRKVTGWEYLTGSLGGNGNFNSLTVAGTITAGNFRGPLTGNAATATTAVGFSGSLFGDVTGTQVATVVSTVAGFSSGIIGARLTTVGNAVSGNTPNTLVLRGAGGNFTGGVISATEFVGPLTGSITGNAATVTTNANLTGEATSLGNAVTLRNSAVIAKTLTGFVSGTGPLGAGDNILSAIQKLDGNIGLKAPIDNPTFSTKITTPAITLGGTPLTADGSEFNFVDGVTSSIQTQLNSKQGALTNSAGLSGALSDESGTGLAVFQTSPTLVTPALGVATATSINGITITTGTGTLTLAAGSTLATSGANSITLTSTGTTNVTLPPSGTLVAAFSGSVNHDFPATSTLSDITLTVNGASDGDPVSLGIPIGSVVTVGAYYAWVSAVNTVTIRFYSPSGALTADPGNGTFKVKVLK